MLLISKDRCVSIGCFRYRLKSSSLLAFKSSRFFFSSVAVSSTLIEPLHTVYPLFSGQLVELPKLLVAPEHVTEDKDTDENLKLLLAPGSSLGSARPKASVVEKDGHLAIVKFPRKDDEYNTVLWEAIALVLGKKAGIVVAEGRIETVADKPVLLRRWSQTNPLLISNEHDRIERQ